MAGIDRGLAADGRIDLGEERGRDLHIVETAADHRGSESGEIADDAAAERQHEIAALDARRDQRFADPLEHGKALRAFARRHSDRRRADPGGGKGSLGRGEMVACDRLVADDRSLGARPQRGNPSSQRGQLAAADHDVVAALAERDIDDDRLAGTQRRSHGARSPSADGSCPASATPMRPASAVTISSTIRSCGTSRDCTVRSARP